MARAWTRSDDPNIVQLQIGRSSHDTKLSFVVFLVKERTVISYTAVLEKMGEFRSIIHIQSDLSYDRKTSIDAVSSYKRWSVCNQARHSEGTDGFKAHWIMKH